MRLKTIVMGLLLLAAATFGNAAVIGFNNLAGPNGTPFVSTTEVGFDVVASAGASWQEAFAVGNPIPSVFNFTAEGEGLVVTRSLGGVFTFDTIDFGTGSFAIGSYDFTLTGLLGGGTQFSQMGTFTGSVGGGFTTVASLFPGVAIDSLELTISNFDISSVNVDNIGVSEVPEPATLSLVGLGLAIGLVKRRRPSAS